MLGEDVQDQGGAVDDLDVHRLLQRQELAAGQLTVADDGVRARGGYDVLEDVDLPGADIGRCIGLVPTLDQGIAHLGTGGFRELGQLGHRGVRLGG